MIVGEWEFEKPGRLSLLAAATAFNSVLRSKRPQTCGIHRDDAVGVRLACFG